MTAQYKRLDEVALRRDTFEEGTRVILADGQEWSLPVPRARYAFDAGPLGFKRRLGLDPAGDDFQDLLDRRQAMAETGDWNSYVASEIAIGRRMLLHNYDLADEQVSALLVFSWDAEDERFFHLREIVMSLAHGLAPASADPESSDDPSTPDGAAEQPATSPVAE